MTITPSLLEAMRSPLEQAACLPADCYRNPDVAQREVESVFLRGWISIGFGQQIPEPGSLLPVTVAGQELLVVRDMEGALRVFHNVCRHRGLRLVEAPCHAAGPAIACPYHHWVYDLRGACKSIPFWDRAKGRPLRPSAGHDSGLIEVRSAVWLDMIFVDLSGEAPAFAEALAPLTARWQADAVPPLAALTTWEATIPANWKLVVENFLDVYHLGFVHPQAGSIKAAAEHEHLLLTPDIFGYRLEEAAVKKARSGPLPSIPGLDQALGLDGEVFVIFPNTLMYAQRSFISLRTLLPRGPSETHEVNLFYVDKAVMTEAFEQERQGLIEGAHLVNDQDLPILSRLQATRGSLAADRARFVPDWDVIPQYFQIRVAEALVSAAQSA